MKCPTSTGVHARPTMYQEGVPRGAIIFFFICQVPSYSCAPPLQNMFRRLWAYGNALVRGGGRIRGLIAQNFTQITGADTGFPQGGDFTSTPPPLDIVCVTSFALRKIEKHPHSWTFTSTPPPLGHCPRDVIRPPGNWKTPPSHHCCCPKKGPPLPKRLSCPKAGGAAAPLPPPGV